MVESYFNSQQCLKSPTSQSSGTLHQHTYIYQSFLHAEHVGHCKRAASQDPFALHGQKKKGHLSWTEVGIITFYWERDACAKTASQEITGVLEKSQAHL